MNSTVANPLRSEALRSEAVRGVSEPAAPVPNVMAALAPIMAVVLVAYLIIGLAMPVLPLYVHERLGLSTFMVGIAAGIQFAAALVSRFWSGRYADTRGAKGAMVAGLLMGAGAGLFYLVSLHFAHAPGTAIAILLLGRVLLGGAESFVITGALSQGLALGGPRNAGRVISWVGTALWAGAAVTGAGYSLVYPGFGLEAVRRAPPESRGLAMGAYTAFLDLSLGIATPALGLVAGHVGLGAVFLVSAAVVLCAAAVAMRLVRAPLPA